MIVNLVTMMDALFERELLVHMEFFTASLNISGVIPFAEYARILQEGIYSKGRIYKRMNIHRYKHKTAHAIRQR